MKNFVFILLLSIVVPFFVYAKNDTLIYKTQQINIEDSLNTHLSKYYNLDIRKIEISNAVQTNPIEFLKLSNSIIINEYGGTGSLATIGIRGASPNQTVISVNGVNITNSANPFFDLNLLPFDLFDQANLILQGTSAIFGSGSIGGVVDFTTSLNPKKVIGSNISLGSFGYQKYTIFQKNLVKCLSNSIATISYETSKNNFPFEYNKFGEIVDTFRQNSQYNSLKFNFFLNQKLSENNTIYSTLSFSKNDQGEPGAVLLGRLEESNAKFKQLSLFVINSINYDNDAINFKYDNLIKFQKNEYHNEFSYLSQTNNFYSFDFNNSFIFNRFFKGIGTVNLEFGNVYNQLHGNMLQKDIGSFVNRNNFYIISGLFNSVFNLPLFYNVSARMDAFYPEKQMAISGLLTLNYYFFDNFKINFTLSRNFRFPSFNEMYYLNYGNSDLKPETSNSATLNFSFLGYRLEFISAFFVNKTYDKIVSIPKSTLSWTAQNYGMVLNYGIDYSISFWIVSNHLNITFNHLLQKTIDNNPSSIYYLSSIPYIPDEKVQINLDYKNSSLHFNINMQRTSFVYFLNENNPWNIIPSKLLINSFFKYTIKAINSNEIILTFYIYNLTNQSYQIVRNYPMPRRSFKLTIGFKYEI